MSTKANDAEFATIGPDVFDPEGVETVELENGDVLLYSREDENAWIRTDDSLDPREMA